MQISKAYFDFPDTELGDEFSFEKLTAESFQQLWLLF